MKATIIIITTIIWIIIFLYVLTNIENSKHPKKPGSWGRAIGIFAGKLSFGKKQWLFIAIILLLIIFAIPSLAIYYIM